MPASLWITQLGCAPLSCPAPYALPRVTVGTKSAGVGGWGWGRKTVRAGLVLSLLTPRLPDAARVGGPEDLGMLVRSGRGAGTSGSPGPGAPSEGSHSPGRRLVGSGPRERPLPWVRGRGAAPRPLVLLPFPDPGSAAPRGNWRWQSGGDGVAGDAGVCVCGCVLCVL